MLEEPYEDIQLEVGVDLSVLLDVELDRELLDDSTQSTCDMATPCSSFLMKVVN